MQVQKGRWHELIFVCHVPSIALPRFVFLPRLQGRMQHHREIPLHRSEVGRPGTKHLHYTEWFFNRYLSEVDQGRLLLAAWVVGATCAFKVDLSHVVCLTWHPWFWSANSCANGNLLSGCTSVPDGRRNAIRMRNSQWRWFIPLSILEGSSDFKQLRLRMWWYSWFENLFFLDRKFNF